ncbi:ABC transporter ATP-binding protein [Eubacterium sp.]|jgi:putative ABC transport system ATP-binding protein|uniref:ABC transporter ATP-binding protein n=1 Tax=Eubacterium sp. TaxID=142586 RepID=UPI0015A26064|nr:ABC transporter ATP-binding protein [Eubacterium sp.]MBS5621149.1 ABC transporter ATP-binding protein [Eubacterium sp.]
MSIIELQNIGKTYGKGESATEALKDINLRIECGEFWSIMGPSGSGKSTLLNILGCMDIPTSGTYLLNGEIVNTLKNEQLSEVRNKTISFVFQHFALLNDYSVYDNIMLPLNCRKMSAGEKKKRVKYYMKRLGIEQLAKKHPTQISGGQQQRVAIARALVTEPEIILADEPTGALDQKTGAELMKLLQEINDEGKTIILVTHDAKVAGMAKKQLFIQDGKGYYEN